MEGHYLITPPHLLYRVTLTVVAPPPPTHPPSALGMASLNVMSLARAAFDGEPGAIRARELLQFDEANANSFWLLFGAYLVFFMQVRA